MGGDVYATELRAHRRSLEGLLAGVGQAALHVTSATVVYCYPFALELDPTDVLELAAVRFGDDRARRTALTDGIVARGTGARPHEPANCAGRAVRPGLRHHLHHPQPPAAKEAERQRRRDAEAAADRQRAEKKLRVALAVLGASSLGGVLNFFHAPLWVAVPAIAVALAAIVFVSVHCFVGAPPAIEIRGFDEGDLPLAARFYDEVLRPSFQADETDSGGIRPSAAR